MTEYQITFEIYFRNGQRVIFKSRPSSAGEVETVERALELGLGQEFHTDEALSFWDNLGKRHFIRIEDVQYIQVTKGTV